MASDSLTGRVCVITGAERGIGAAVVSTVMERGAHVVINYLSDSQSARDLASDLSARGPGRAVAVQGDVSQRTDLERLVTAAVTEFGRLDVWVNNAGVELGGSLLDTADDDLDKTLAVNLRGVVVATQLAARRFVAQGHGGVIVNLTSIHEEWPMPGNMAYCVAKGGVQMLTRTAGVELAPHGVRIVNVAPGAVETPMNSETTDDPETLNRLVKRIPAGRLASPRDVAEVVAFAASDAARYVTATTIVVDGAMMQRGSDL